MSSFQCCELLAKNSIFKKESAMSAEEAKDHTYQEPDGVYHATVLSHSACAEQRSILLKSQADRILARYSAFAYTCLTAAERNLLAKQMQARKG
jgi:hypothetical protein